MAYRAVKCSCGDAICDSWHVSGVAQVQGVRFSAAQAAMVAQLLTDLEKPAYYSAWRICHNEDMADYGSDSISLCAWGGECTFDEAVREVRIAAGMFENSDYTVEMRREHGDAQNFTVVPRAAWEPPTLRQQRYAA